MKGKGHPKTEVQQKVGRSVLTGKESRGFAVSVHPWKQMILLEVNADMHRAGIIRQARDGLWARQLLIWIDFTTSV